MSTGTCDHTIEAAYHLAIDLRGESRARSLVLSSECADCTVRRVRPLWREGVVRELVAETVHATTIILDVPEWPGHVPGQYVDVRLTAPDGYETERSYSIASAPEDRTLALTVERIPDGEVSRYLVDQLRPGDPLELRGPIGGSFTWRTSDGGPLLLIAGGSGLVPLMAMLRHRARQHSTIETRLLASTRSADELLYHDELAELNVTDGLTIRSGRSLDAGRLRMLGPAPARRPRIFISGPTTFVGGAADLLVALGHDRATIRVQDFGINSA